MIPLCHPIPIEAIKIDFSINEKDINVLATVSTTNKTGVEMEALVAVNIACLTIYDMVKSVDKKAKLILSSSLEKVGEIRRLEKKIKLLSVEQAQRIIFKNIKPLKFKEKINIENSYKKGFKVKYKF